MNDNFIKSSIIGIVISLILLLIVVSIGVYYSVKANTRIISILDDNQITSLESIHNK